MAGLARSALPRPTALPGPLAARLHLGLLGSSGGGASAWAGAPPMRPKEVEGRRHHSESWISRLTDWRRPDVA